jgi:hypothetical protein
MIPQILCSLSQARIDSLIKLASTKCGFIGDDDFDVSDGGNFDDTYQMGCDAGEISLARTILDDLKIEYTIEED